MQDQSTDQTGLLVCGFSPDGSHIVAGSSDCHIYAWFWDIAAVADKGKAAAKQGFYNVVSEEDAARNLAPAAAVDLEAVDWPEPQETCRLGGHVNDVLLLQFSHDGQSIATGSKDGTMRVSTHHLKPYRSLRPVHNTHPCTRHSQVMLQACALSSVLCNFSKATFAVCSTCLALCVQAG